MFSVHAFLVSALAAAPQLIPNHPQESPAAIARTLQLESVKATIRISEVTATTDLEQVFRNTLPTQTEGTYLWPIPEGATVSQFELWVDGKPLKGELLDKDRARGVYEQIVRSQRDPGLLEWAGLGCVKASIFPIPANGEARVRLRYTQMLGFSGGAYEYALPLRISALAPGGLRSLVIDGAVESARAIAAVYSPSHAIDVRRDGETKARFSFEANNPRLERDFSLVVGPADRELGALLLTHRRTGEDGFFSLVLTPRMEVPASEVQPKDVIFVVDTSGSMAGDKIAQAKKALHQVLARLNTNDRFGLIRFSTEADPLRTDLLSPTKENRDAADRWIDALEARGGTNIEEALTRALAMRGADSRLSMVFFLTDGLPTVGTTDIAQLLSIVKERNKQGLRIFTFGVGFDVNTRLLDTIANDTRAAREYVRPDEDVEIKVSTLFDKVSSPALSNVSLVIDGVEVSEIYPRRLPDLFRGSQFLVTGRYRGDGKARIRLSGTIGDTKKGWDYDFDFPKSSERQDSLRPLWASRKVGFLLDEIRLRGASPELVDEVKRIGREYNIVTPYTSFLVVEEGRRLARARGVDERKIRLGLDGGLDGVDSFHLALDEDAEAKESVRLLDDLSTATSGESAVAGSLAAKALGGALAPAASQPARGRGEALSRAVTRSVGDRTFQWIGSAWVDTTFTEADRAKVIKVAFLSDEYFALLRKHPELAKYFAIGSHVVALCSGIFYEVE